MVGQQISHFYIIRAIGSGGMGVVYEAQDTRLPRAVAIKVLNPSLARNSDAIRRFKREARLASSLNHPNICTVLDIDDGDGVSFIAMELLRGRNLKAVLSSGPLPEPQLLDIAMQIADALAAAHSQGIIHRDITPANVFLTDTGLVKLLDFGVAKHFPMFSDTASGEEATTTETVAGTLHYMAPERFTPDAVVDHRCDLFSLGVILYEMAAGTRPFDIAPRSALIAAIQQSPHVPLQRLAPDCSIDLARVVDRLLAKRPEDRYQSAGELRADLDDVRHNAAATSVSVVPDAVSIAVLPFEVIGCSDDVTRQFRDGLAEDLATSLTRIAELRVAPRTSTRHLAGLSLPEIGTALGVRFVIEGSVQGSEGRARVHATLVDVASQRAVTPAITLDCQLADTLAAQDSAAREICRAVKPFLGRTRQRRREPDPEAYHALQRGLHQWRSCLWGSWGPALEHLRYAIERDPQYAAAHVAFANAYNFLGFYSLIKPASAFAVAADAAARALALDATVAAAYRELALAKLGGEWDWEGAEENFRRALAFDDADPLAHIHYSWLLILLGREAAAITEADRGHALAPTSRLVNAGRAQMFYIARRFDQAVEICNRCLAADPEYVFALHLRGLCALATGRDSAPDDLERAATLGGRSPFYLGLLGHCYAQIGRRQQALRLIRELEALERHTYVAPQTYVFIYAGLGERQRALEFQERAYGDGASPFNYLVPTIRELYALDPYHKKRLEQMRLSL